MTGDIDEAASLEGASRHPMAEVVVGVDAGRTPLNDPLKDCPLSGVERDPAAVLGIRHTHTSMGPVCAHSEGPPRNLTECSLATCAVFADGGEMEPAITDDTQQTFEHEGLLWKRLPGGTSTFEEFVAAGVQWMEIFHETQWNPWRKEELQPTSERARAVREEWTRAEPGHRMMTAEEFAAWTTEMDHERDARRAADEARWERDKVHYSEQREHARYALLEREATRVRLMGEIQGLRSGAVFPGMPSNARAKRIAGLESERDHNEAEISKLAETVGDPETVVDVHGRLPRDRRPLTLVGYDCDRRFRVEDLQTSIAAQQEALATEKDRTTKSSLRARVAGMERELTALLAMPRLTPDDMCADCDTPMAQHLAQGGEARGCPYWPVRAARMEQAWENVRRILENAKTTQPALPKPEPLATLPGSLGIGEVIERLKELQAKHPDAVVKRGRANRWELWPAERGQGRATEQPSP